MRQFLLLALLVGVAHASLFTEDELDAEFAKFKTDYGRVYKDSFDELYRRSIFATNMEFILEHNKAHAMGMKGFTVAINQFADLTNVEFRQIFNGYRSNSQHRLSSNETFVDENVSDLPATVDWTTKGLVTPIKNQGQCGSCWAFSAVASIEGQHAKKTGKLVSLSESNLADCSYPEGNEGCDGGLMDNAFRYVIENRGIDTEASYPYNPVDEKCAFKKSTVGATISNYVDVKRGSEAALQAAVAKIGPISVAIDASQDSFQFYSSGVYDELQCSSIYLDHGVTAVGYGTLNGTPYWKVKNSWGTTWGEKGYILMSRNKDNQCGIATQSSYPVV